MNHTDFKSKWIGKGYAENAEYWYQCVAWVKCYAQEVFGKSLWSFCGSAYNGWTTWSPFDSDFTRIVSDSKIQIIQWDIAFFAPTSYNPYGHVGIIDKWFPTSIDLLNQNYWNGDGKWSDDYFKISKFNGTDPKFLWVFRFKSLITSNMQDDYIAILNKEFPKRKPIISSYEKDGQAKALAELITLRELKAYWLIK